MKTAIIYASKYGTTEKVTNSRFFNLCGTGVQKNIVHLHLLKLNV